MRALLDLVWRNKIFFLLATVLALGLRLFLVFKFSVVAGDSLVYGDIAKNWLTHGIYGLTSGQNIQPTLIRLPGYPAFLAVMFRVFGSEHYNAVMIAQAFIDTNTCLVIAGIALELMHERAAKAAYLLAALCPFTANYTAAPLSETLAICTTAHALYYGVRALRTVAAADAGARLWLICGLWIAASIYLRPDDVLLLAPFGLALLVYAFRLQNKWKPLMAGLLLASAALIPLTPWTVRNWHTFHVFQPLAPRYANDPDEDVPLGFNQWVKTWTVDFVSVVEVYWKVPGEALNIDDLPERAFDSRSEYDRTDELIADYNQQTYVDPELDQRFARLAGERVTHNPFRYYAWLPSLRIMDMWLRPRIEMLPVETRWWEFSEHRWQTIFAVFWGALNVALLVAAARGWRRNSMGVPGLVLIGFVLIRSIFLGSLENPEPRYVLECYPVVLALAGGALVRKSGTDAQSVNQS